MKLGLGDSLDEAIVRLDIPGWDPENPEEEQALASVEIEEDEGTEEDVDAALDDEDLEGDEEGEEEELEFDMEDLAESFEIDPEMLRSEMKRLRRGLAEAKELAKLKGIKDGDQLELEVTAQSKTAEDYDAGRDVTASVWRLHSN